MSREEKTTTRVPFGSGPGLLAVTGHDEHGFPLLELIDFNGAPLVSLRVGNGGWDLHTTPVSVAPVSDPGAEQAADAARTRVLEQARELRARLLDLLGEADDVYLGIS